MATKDNSQVRRVVPKTKDELIKMLTERLELAEVVVVTCRHRSQKCRILSRKNAKNERH
jgi:hypothetical protein